MSTTLYEDFLKYRDYHGLNQHATDGVAGRTSQNGALFTVEYLICLINNPTAPQFVKQNEINRLKEVIGNLEVLPGLSVRFPHSLEFDSMDNNVALLVFSAMYGNQEYAKRMRDHGLNVKCTGIDSTQGAESNLKFYKWAKILGLGKVRNYWNNNTPSLFTFFGWYGRSPGFMGLIDICATGNSSLFRKFSLLVGQMVGVYFTPKSQDSLKLSYVAWHLLKNRNWLWAQAYKKWLKQLFKHYPKGMSNVYSDYFGSSHPLVAHTVHDTYF